MVVYSLPPNAKTLLGLFCISNCIHLCSHITLSSSSNVNIVQWLVSVPVVRLFVGSALTISFGLAFRLEVTPLIGGLLMYFFKRFRVDVYVSG